MNCPNCGAGPEWKDEYADRCVNCGEEWPTETTQDSARRWVVGPSPKRDDSNFESDATTRAAWHW